MKIKKSQSGTPRLQKNKSVFLLRLYDRNHKQVNIGDIVKISNGREFSFWSEVKYLEAEKKIAPFHTFSFHSFEKVNSLPDHAVKSTETRYRIWYTHTPESDYDAKDFEGYLTDWRVCEHLLDKSAFTLELYE